MGTEPPLRFASTTRGAGVRGIAAAREARLRGLAPGVCAGAMTTRRARAQLANREPYSGLPKRCQKCRVTRRRGLWAFPGAVCALASRNARPRAERGRAVNFRARGGASPPEAREATAALVSRKRWRTSPQRSLRRVDSVARCNPRGVSEIPFVRATRRGVRNVNDRRRFRRGCAGRGEVGWGWGDGGMAQTGDGWQGPRYLVGCLRLLYFLATCARARGAQRGLFRDRPASSSLHPGLGSQGPLAPAALPVDRLRDAAAGMKRAAAGKRVVAVGRGDTSCGAARRCKGEGGRRAADGRDRRGVSLGASSKRAWSNRGP